MDCFIVTGGSRGLGKSFVDLVGRGDTSVLSISRTIGENTPLKRSVSLDLSNTNQVLAIFESNALDELKEKYQRFHLILNAAQIEPIKRIDRATNEEIVNHLNLNLVNSILLIKNFLSFTEGKERTIVTVGSSAAQKSIPGWSLYCCSKAGLVMFTECLRDDFKSDEKTRIAFFNPGLMDTEMQKTIRAKSSEDFPNLNDFVAYKKNNQLSNTDEVAIKLLGLVKSLWN